jgi:hypothetical protein
LLETTRRQPEPINLPGGEIVEREREREKERERERERGREGKRDARIRRKTPA